MWGLLNFIRRNRKLFLLVNVLRSVKKYGFIKTIREIIGGMRLQKVPLQYYKNLSKNERKSQSNMIFYKKLKISIITSLHNTPEQYVKDVIESVMEQTYGNWELCLVDGSDEDNTTAKQACDVYIQKDKRIKYKKVDIKMGISERLNEAIRMSSGDFIGHLHQSDVLHPSCLYEVMKAICNEDADFIYSDEAYFSESYYVSLRHHKPGYAVDTLCSYNYISHFTAFSRNLINKAGIFRSEFDGSQDYDLIFRLTDIASKIYHIPRLLYFHRNDKKPIPSDVKKKMENISAAERVINDYLRKHGKNAEVQSKIELPGYFRIIYELTEKPMVSIIIPNKDNASMLRKCLSSILHKTTYQNYEIIIVENNSKDDATFALYEEIKRYKNINILYWKEQGFNFSEICNFGVQHANGQQLLFLNNDVIIISPNWIEEMLMYSQRKDVGAVGAKLYYINGSIQHAGVILGMGDVAAHIYHGAPHDAVGYMGRLQIAQNISLITAACMMIKKQVFEEVGCFALEFPNSFNDVDLCLKVRKAGLLIIWTPYAEAYHLESKSRGYNTSSQRKLQLANDTALFRKRWEKELAAGDPYFNVNFSMEKNDYSFK